MKWLALAVVVVACLLRFVHLDADPHYYGWAGHIRDEGRWVEHARSLVLRGNLIEHDQNHHLAIAPGFVLATAAVYVATGVDRLTSRIFPAVCGAGLIVLLWWHLRRRVTPEALLAALALVALQADYVVLSRLAVPETPIMLGALAVFVIAVSGAPSPRRFLLAGLVTLATLAVKATALGMVGIFALVIALRIDGTDGTNETDEPAPTVGRRLGNVLWYLLGVGGLAIVGLALSAPVWLPRAARFKAHLGFAADFVGVNDLFTALTLPLDGFAAPVLNTAALGLWAALLSTRVASDESLETRRNVRAAWIWFGLFALQGMVLSYFPPRYLVQGLTPLALLTAFGLTRLQHAGLDGLAAGLERGRPGGVALLALPSGILLAPLVGRILAALSSPPDQFRERVLCLGMGWVLAFLAAWATAVARAGLVAWLAFPAAGTLLWLVQWCIADVGMGFWDASAGAWLALLGLAGVLAALAAALRERPAARYLVPALALAWLGGWAVHLAPGFVSPRFTARDASRDLARRLPADALVAQASAKGLFLDNALGIRRLDPEHWREQRAENVLILFPHFPELAGVLELYEPVTVYDIYVPRSYRGLDPGSQLGPCAGTEGRCAVLLRRR